MCYICKFVVLLARVVTLLIQNLLLNLGASVETVLLVSGRLPVFFPGRVISKALEILVAAARQGLDTSGKCEGLGISVLFVFYVHFER